jgi:shikimate dehydrogenase
MKKITAKTALLGVVGDPVGHSLSPVMHNGWFEDHGIDAVYVALPLKSSDPVAAFKALKSLGLKGANVTVPFKDAAAAAADRAEASAVNVLRWESDGSVSGFNTDGLGFLDALEEAAPSWETTTTTILILGAGGSAYGIAATLADRANLIIANRTYARAAALAEQFPRARAAAWDALPACFADADLIVQTTTLGMGDNPSPDWPIAQCRKGAIVVDIVYRPLETPLLKAARAQGLITVDGLGMLIHQAVRSFDIWFGIKPDPESARRRMLEALGETP